MTKREKEKVTRKKGRWCPVNAHDGSVDVVRRVDERTETVREEICVCKSNISRKSGVHFVV